MEGHESDTGKRLAQKPSVDNSRPHRTNPAVEADEPASVLRQASRPELPSSQVARLSQRPREGFVLCGLWRAIEDKKLLDIRYSVIVNYNSAGRAVCWDELIASD